MTTTQIYYNHPRNCCMTRIWYMESVEGKIVQLMREIPTDVKTAAHFLSTHKTV